jgi:hypothetical protein
MKKKQGKSNTINKLFTNLVAEICSATCTGTGTGTGTNVTIGYVKKYLR